MCTVPIFFALLPNKERVTYDRVYAIIKGLWPALAPTSITTDLEIALWKAGAEAFNGVALHGFFICSQCVYLFFRLLFPF